MKQNTTGVLCALSAYLIWGLLAAYWKLFSGVPAVEIMAHRIFWAMLFSAAVLIATGKASAILKIYSKPKTAVNAVVRALLLSLNWYTYIWGLGNGYVLEASLGYYLNPLISIFLGMLFLKERLNRLQWAALGFAVLGVGIKTMLVGRFPLIAVILAFSFGIYGLLKKKSAEGSLEGIAAETLAAFPVSLIILFVTGNGIGTFPTAAFPIKLLFLSTGIVTLVPLVLFAKAAGKIPLFWVGFLQFVAPTLMMIFGLLLYHESMDVRELSGFISVWAGIAVFIFASYRKQQT